MPINNTTQNKEELEHFITSLKLCLYGFDGDGFDADEWIKNLTTLLSRAISQAHQSGIEEERKRIAKIIADKFLLTLDLNTWTAESAKAETLFNNSKEIKNWNKAMNILLESLKENND